MRLVGRFRQNCAVSSAHLPAQEGGDLDLVVFERPGLRAAMRVELPLGGALRRLDHRAAGRLGQRRGRLGGHRSGRSEARLLLLATAEADGRETKIALFPAAEEKPEQISIIDEERQP